MGAGEGAVRPQNVAVLCLVEVPDAADARLEVAVPSDADDAVAEAQVVRAKRAPTPADTAGS